MYPYYRNVPPIHDQRFFGFGLPLAVGGLGFLGGLLGGALVSRPWGYPGFGYPGFGPMGYPGFGYPGFGPMGYPGMGFGGYPGMGFY